MTLLRLLLQGHKHASRFFIDFFEQFFCKYNLHTQESGGLDLEVGLVQFSSLLLLSVLKCQTMACQAMTKTEVNLIKTYESQLINFAPMYTEYEAEKIF